MRKLSPREIQVLNEVVKGKSNIEIGEALGISTDTVKMYLKTTFAKLNVTNRVGAAVQAVVLGIVKTDDFIAVSSR